MASLRLAAWLIVVLIAMAMLAVLLPQKAYLGDQFRDFVRDVPWLASAMAVLSLDRVFTGWPIAVVAALLALNVSACTFMRLRAHGRTPQVAVSRDAHVVDLERDVDADDLVSLVEDELVASGFTVLSRGREGLVARAGGSGFWGSMVLHVSLLVIILGGAATALTSFRGELAITDGQTISDSADSYLKVIDEPELGDAFSGTQVTLDSTEVRYERGVLVSAVARMRAVEPSGRLRTKSVRVNHPLDAGGKAYLLQDSGYAVALVVGTTETAPGELVVRLAERTSRGWRDSIDLGELGGRRVELEMTATPVPLGPGADLPVEEFTLSDPRLQVRLMVGDEIRWEGSLAEGEDIPSGTGIVLRFERLHLWNRFLVRGEPARWITYLGFWLAVAGSAWRFAVPERRVSVAIRRVDDRMTAAIALRARPWSGRQSVPDGEMVRRLLSIAEGKADVPS